MAGLIMLNYDEITKNFPSKIITNYTVILFNIEF